MLRFLGPLLGVCIATSAFAANCPHPGVILETGPRYDAKKLFWLGRDDNWVQWRSKGWMTPAEMETTKPVSFSRVFLSKTTGQQFCQYKTTGGTVINLYPQLKVGQYYEPSQKFGEYDSGSPWHIWSPATGYCEANRQSCSFILHS